MTISYIILVLQLAISLVAASNSSTATPEQKAKAQAFANEAMVMALSSLSSTSPTSTQIQNIPVQEPVLVLGGSEPMVLPAVEPVQTLKEVPIEKVMGGNDWGKGWGFGSDFVQYGVYNTAKIQITLNGTTKQAEGVGQKIRFDGLTPGTEYQFSIRAERSGEFGTAESVIRTK